MKRIIVIFVFVCNISAFLPVKAQEYVPFPTVNAEWKIMGFKAEPPRTIFNSPKSIFQYELSQEDTVIDGKLYNVLYYDHYLLYPSPHNESGYYAGIREENKQVFVNLPEWGEHLLYDFNLEIGDTIFYTLGGDIGLGGAFIAEEVHFDILASIDSMELYNGQYRKRWNLKRYYYDYEGESREFGAASWIEGIGDVYWIGLFNPFVTRFALNYDEFHLLCFSLDQFPYYLHPECPDCTCSMLSSVEELVGRTFTLFPNPVVDKFTVSSSDIEIKSILLFDYMGRELRKMRMVNSFDKEVDLSGYAPGVYFIHINTAMGVFTQKIIKQ